MALLVQFIVFSGIFALTSAAVDLSRAEWTGKPWLGTWKSVKEENWQNLFDAHGVATHYEGVSSAKGIVSLWKAGDHFHHVFTIPDKNFKNELEFKLGEEFTHTDHGSVFKVTFSEDGDKLAAQIKTPASSKEVHWLFDVVGEQLKFTYKHGEVTKDIWFDKAANPTSTA